MGFSGITKAGGYFTVTGRDTKHCLLRLKEDNDGAEPAASSSRSAEFGAPGGPYETTPSCWARAKKTVNAFARQLAHFPSALPQMLVAFDFLERSPRQIVIAGDFDSPKTKALLAEVHRHFLPNKVLLLADGARGPGVIGEKNEAVRAMSMVGGKPTAYVCENFACKAPVTVWMSLEACSRVNNCGEHGPLACGPSGFLNPLPSGARHRSKTHYWSQR